MWWMWLSLILIRNCDSCEGKNNDSGTEVEGFMEKFNEMEGEEGNCNNGKI